MTRDLEETLNELGPGYREVVDRLTGAYQPLVDAASSPRCSQNNPSAVDLDLQSRPSSSPGRIVRWTVGYLLAASLLVFLGLGVIFRLGSDRGDGEVASSRGSIPANCAGCRIYTIAYAADETALRAIVASQRADGSWSNDFITRQNAAALRGAGDAASLVAYKRALRYLRSRGLEPLTEDELKARAARARI